VSRVLVIDDEASVARASARMLSTEYEVVIYVDARKAIEGIRSGERITGSRGDLIRFEADHAPLVKIARPLANAALSPQYCQPWLRTQESQLLIVPLAQAAQCTFGPVPQSRSSRRKARSSRNG
jgi:hypothetical protein